MRVSKRVLIAVAAGISIALSGVVAGSAQAAVKAPQAAAKPAALGYTTGGVLTGVAAASNSDAWAVGYTGLGGAPEPIMLHWNGTAWSRVTSPSVLTGDGGLNAVTVVNADDAWAVGYTGETAGVEHSLLLHWNGKAWSQVTSPAPVTGGSLSGIAVSGNSGWAVGYVNANPDAPASSAGTPLVFRWNGSTWTRVTTKLGNGAYLNSVAITATNTAWATGSPEAMITGELAKWNGSSWSWVTDPVAGAYRPLSAIAAGPGGTAFIVGTNNDKPAPPISAQWNGKAWKAVTVSAPNSSQLGAVAFAPGGTAWAAGSTFSADVYQALVLRWNGKAWVRVTSPGAGVELDGLAFSAANYGWAVGVIFDRTANGSSVTAILHWNGTTWK